MWWASLLGCRALQGPFGFGAFDPVIMPCVTAEGEPIAVGWVAARQEAWRDCLSFLEEVPDRPEGPYESRCETTAPLLRDPESGLCSSETSFLQPRREQLLWFWSLDAPDAIDGAVADEVDHTECGGPADDEDGPNTHTALTGSVEVVEDRGDTALVAFALDGVWGELEFEVCR